MPDYLKRSDLIANYRALLVTYYEWKKRMRAVYGEESSYLEYDDHDMHEALTQNAALTSVEKNLGLTEEEIREIEAAVSREVKGGRPLKVID